MLSGASGIILDLHYVVHILLIDSFLPPCGNFFAREPLNQLEISALTECELKRFSVAFHAGVPSPFVCLPRARLFSLSSTTSKCLVRRLTKKEKECKSPGVSPEDIVTGQIEQCITSFRFYDILRLHYLVLNTSRPLRRPHITDLILSNKGK